MNLQEMPVVAIWLLPNGEDTDACIIAEMVGGPKPYVRHWLDSHAIEWGHVVPDTAMLIWQAERPRRNFGVVFDHGWSLLLLVLVVSTLFAVSIILTAS